MRALVVAALFLATSAAAQTPTEQRPEQRRTIIDIEESVIEGSLHNPDVVVTPATRSPHFNSLIRVRKNFSAELLASASQL